MSEEERNPLSEECGSLSRYARVNGLYYLADEIAKVETKVRELEAREQRIRREGFDQGYREAKMIHGGDQQAAVNRAIESESVNPWKAALINELIVDHIYSKDNESNPRKALHDALNGS